MPRNKSGSANGGVIGKTNKISFGKCTVTTKTSSGTVSQHSQELELFKQLIVSGGAGGGTWGFQALTSGGGGAGGGGILQYTCSNNCLWTNICYSRCWRIFFK
jgi:hypothetical protein